MNMLRRRRPWREPPIVFQIVVLLLGSLIVSQLVTLLLTLVFPPAPPAQHGMADIVASFRGEAGGDRLARTVQSGPPDVSGPGWFTSDGARHELAARLGARDADVRLSFYAPLPFAGITAPPSQPPLPIRRIAWSVSPEPLRPMAARLMPASLMLIDQGGPPTGGGAPGGGFPAGGQGGGFPGSGFPGSGFPGDGTGGRGQGAAMPGGGRPGQGQGLSGGQFRQDQRQRGGSPSPGDLDRQPAAPSEPGAPSQERAAGPQSILSQDQRGFDRRIPTEGFDMHSFGPAPQPMPETRAPPAPAATATVAPPAAPAAPASRPADTAKSATPETAPAVAAPAVGTLETTRRRASAEPRPLPIAAKARSLFGLAPAPFVEGDFVAAVRLRDGRWLVVQPIAGAFPNAWQRRVMLWFVIAFAMVAPIGWLFARHIVRPLARFTAAAEQLGRDPSAALVALEGPAEIGRAAHAFNVMQSRLRSFVDDRTAMVGAISHDLRTPLTRMRFRIEEVDDDLIRDGMSGEVTEMEAMISSVLNFIRDASTPNARERLDLGLLVEDVVEDAMMVGSEVTVEESAAAPVEVDVLGMRRLLTNLVENAVKYGDRARIRLAVDDDAVIAEIRDDGPGVPEDELERAFEPFYRASNAATSGKQGSGLGLAVCRSIARAHGGDVRLVRSREGFAAQLILPLAYGVAPLAA